jgi:3-methyl-2-oxobutanoate hydroxymethyltransferase
MIGRAERMERERQKITISDFAGKKKRSEKITALTAYDYPTARILDSVGVDMILVGDSLGMSALGYESTLPVTMDEMIHHAKAVRRGTVSAFLVGDMPFMSYQASSDDAVRHAGRFIKEAGCDAVKIEGGRDSLQRVEAVLKAGIPVLGHVGLTPQSVKKIGGYKVQGKDASSRERIADDALLLEKAGCFAVIIECVPKELASEIKEKLSIPVIGIGAGPYCDGQVLVTSDIIGFFDAFTPKFAKRYADVSASIRYAARSFKNDVESGVFPDEEHSF